MKSPNKTKDSGFGGGAVLAAAGGGAWGWAWGWGGGMPAPGSLSEVRWYPVVTGAKNSAFPSSSTFRWDGRDG